MSDLKFVFEQGRNSLQNANPSTEQNTLQVNLTTGAIELVSPLGVIAQAGANAGNNLFYNKVANVGFAAVNALGAGASKTFVCALKRPIDALPVAIVVIPRVRFVDAGTPGLTAHVNIAVKVDGAFVTAGGATGPNIDGAALIAAPNSVHRQDVLDFIGGLSQNTIVEDVNLILTGEAADAPTPFAGTFTAGSADVYVIWKSFGSVTDFYDLIP